MRKEFLKGYVMSLLGDGTLKGSYTVREALAKASAAFAKDFAEVGGELLELAAGQVVNHAAVVAQEKVGQLAQDIAQRGLSAVLTDLGRVYRGVRGRG